MACRNIIHGARGLAVGVLTPIPLRLGLGRPGPRVIMTRTLWRNVVMKIILNINIRSVLIFG